MAGIKSVKVKARFSVLVSEIMMKGNAQNRPGRDGPQSKIVVDSPTYVLPYLEFVQRKGDVARVIDRGWQLIDEDPPEVWLGDVVVSAAGVVTFSGKVRSNNVATTCLFQVDVLPDFSTMSETAADESPVTSEDDEIITASEDLSLYPGYTFYVRVRAYDARKQVYSIVKTIQIPIPVI